MPDGPALVSMFPFVHRVYAVFSCRASYNGADHPLDFLLLKLNWMVQASPGSRGGFTTKEIDVKWCFSLALTVALWGLGWAQEKKEPTEDSQKFQGKWEMLEGEHNGEKFPEDFIKGFKLSFEKDKYDAKLAAGDGEEGTFKVNAKDTPKKSLTFTNNGNEVRQAIYEWDGDKLKLCISDRGGEKPKEFAAKDGNLLMVLKKSK
jgi:uncharacterized protein (TIGR03067 family)